jgi:hypothetical protein
MRKILEASYNAGAKGIEAIPIGDILITAKEMIETHNDYVLTGSTYPGRNSRIEELINAGAKLIFIHGTISDKGGKKLFQLLDEVNSRGIISGIATHEPVTTIEYVIKHNLNTKAFLVPFNANGNFMESKKKLEEIVDSTRNYYFVGMKTLAAGTLNPKKAFEYVASHNISAVTIGLVSEEEANMSTKIALKALSSNNSNNI